MSSGLTSFLMNFMVTENNLHFHFMLHTILLPVFLYIFFTSDSLKMYKSKSGDIWESFKTMWYIVLMYDHLKILTAPYHTALANFSCKNITNKIWADCVHWWVIGQIDIPLCARQKDMNACAHKENWKCECFDRSRQKGANGKTPRIKKIPLKLQIKLQDVIFGDKI